MFFLVLVLAILICFVGFLLGMQYERHFWWKICVRKEKEMKEKEVKMSRETQKLMLEYFKRVSAPRILEKRRKEREEKQENGDNKDKSWRREERWDFK